MLVKPTIKAEIKGAFEAVMNDQGDRTEALDKLADTLADALINAIKAQQITYTTGLVSPTGPVTGTLNYTIQ